MVITPKQDKLGKALVENSIAEQPKNLKQILEDVGYAESTAESNAKDIIERPGVQASIEKHTSEMLGAMEAQGITPFYIAGKIKDLLEAKKITKVAGQIESIEVDSKSINFGLNHALKLGLGGGYKTDGEGNKPSTNIQINVLNSPRVQALVQDFEQKLKEELTKPE